MDAAIRWVGDFVRGREGAWPDRGVRLRVVAIASAIVISSLSTIADNVRQGLLTTDQVVYSLLALVFMAAAVGLIYRSKAAYIAAYLYVFTLAASLSTPSVWLIVFSGVAWNGQNHDPITPMAIVDVWAVIWVAFFVFVALKFSEVSDAFRRIGSKFESAIAGFIIVGWIFLAVWSVIDTIVGNSFVQAWLVDPDYLASLRLGLVAFVMIPIFGFCLWSYTTLRSRAVRDAFGLP